MKGHKFDIAQIKSQKSQSILLLLLYPTFANSARRSHGIMKIVVILCVSVRHLCGWGVDLKPPIAFHQPLTRLALPWNCQGLHLQVILARWLLCWLLNLTFWVEFRFCLFKQGKKVFKSYCGLMLSLLWDLFLFFATKCSSRAKWSPEAAGGETMVSC